MPASKVDAITVDASGFTRFARDLKAANPQMQKSLLKGIKTEVTSAVVPKAKTNASWSKRIPPTVKVSSTSKGVSVKAGGAGAPHAAAFEHDGTAGNFRHPVMGDRDVWVDQAARPFITPAVKASEQQILGGIVKAMDDWATKAGFR